MSYDVKAIIEKHKSEIVITADNTKLIAWLLGLCIAEDMTNHPLGTNQVDDPRHLPGYIDIRWDVWDRQICEKEIIKELNSQFKIDIKYDSIYNKPNSEVNFIYLPLIKKVANSDFKDIIMAQNMMAPLPNKKIAPKSRIEAMKERFKTGK